MPEGSLAPRVYLVGEAPGRQEVEIGRPFTGLAGKALRDMIREAGMEEAQIRLANALPYRPIERSSQLGLRNRRPTRKEVRDYGALVLADIAIDRKSSSRWGSAAPRYSAHRGRSRTLAEKCYTLQIFRSGLPTIPASYCGSAGEDRSYGKRRFVICVPIGNSARGHIPQSSRGDARVD